jgi:hypothetical protein
MIQSVSELLKVKKRKAGTVPSHFFVVVGDWRIWKISTTLLFLTKKANLMDWLFEKMDLT